jgi:hypothetical protein
MYLLVNILLESGRVSRGMFNYNTLIYIYIYEYICK